MISDYKFDLSKYADSNFTALQLEYLIKASYHFWLKIYLCQCSDKISLPDRLYWQNNITSTCLSVFTFEMECFKQIIQIIMVNSLFNKEYVEFSEQSLFTCTKMSFGLMEHYIFSHYNCMLSTTLYWLLRICI